MILRLVALSALLLPSTFFAAENLLLNPELRFTSLEPLRTASTRSSEAESVPFWESGAYGQARAVRGPAITGFRPTFPVEAAVCIAPGGSLRQWVLVSEGKLEPGGAISAAVNGFLPEGAGLEMRLLAMMSDEEEGKWTPKELGQNDARTFPKAARGELTPVLMGEAKAIPAEAAKDGSPFAITISDVKLPGGDGATRQAVAVELVFTNPGSTPAWIYAPRLVQGAAAPETPLAGRALPEAYRSLPRTVSKLHAGEPLHIIVMGSSIDRASANPPLYRYDEAPDSPTFKQPLSKGDRLFVGEEVGAPELTPYYGWWAHYYNYAGRLRLRLMKRFGLPAEKLMINFMAADGSSIGESHSALATWAGLKNPPSPGENGHATGSDWAKLYPGLFTRPEGPRPDLVIFGSGANEKIDGSDEVAAFEGAIRWFQRHYPGTEFVIAMWNHQERYTPNTAMMRQLSLRYGIPCIEVGRELHLLTRHVNPLHLTPSDGHPQAAAHDLWGRLLERAFQMADPMQPGLPQQYLPERLSHYTLNWEGDTTTYNADSPRIYNKRAFLFDDAAVNVWAKGELEKGKSLEFLIDGLPTSDKRFGNGSRLRAMNARDARNSSFAIGRLTLGDRHLLELANPSAELVAVDSKTALQRRWHPISSQLWQSSGGAITPQSFQSKWGAPYGTQLVQLQPGQSIALEWTGTLASVAWHQSEGGGTVVAKIAGEEAALKRSTGEPTLLADGTKLLMEDRAALPELPYGVHRLEITAEGGPVALLGAFTYDTRANRVAERVEAGIAAPGDQLTFSAPYAAAPLVLCTGGLKIEQVTREGITFGGTAAGNYQIVGQ